MKQSVIAIDIETVGLKPYKGTIWMISVTTAKGKTQVYHDCFGNTAYIEKLRADLENPAVLKLVHNAEFDVPYIQLNTGVRVRNIWDTMLAETVIQGTQIPRGSKDERLKVAHGTSLKNVLARYGLPAPDKSVRENFIARPKGTAFTKKEIDYAAGDTKHLHTIQKAQEYLLTRDGGLEVALLENKLVEVVTSMRVAGLGVDVQRWNEIADANLARYKKIIATLPPLQNWNSTQQVKAFFNSRGIAINSYSELDAVAQATGDKVLKRFIEARNIYSDATAYGRKWLLDDNGNSVVDDDGRIRTSFQQILNTGRFATSAPNILALPKGGLQRSAIVPKRGNLFVIGDYSGQEIGIIAAASKDDLWINTLLRGESVHSLIASLLFPAEWQRGKERGCTFPKKCRCKLHQDLPGLPYFKAKKLNFMLAYGGGPQKFGEITGADELTSRVTVTKYKRVIPKIVKYLDTNAALAVKHGVAYSADPYKRRIVLRGQEEWQIANQGKNYPIQSAGANMLKLAMISMPEWMQIVLPFHDELVVEVPFKLAPKAAKVMKSVMEQSAAYITGIDQLIRVEPRVAKNFSKM